MTRRLETVAWIKSDEPPHFRNYLVMNGGPWRVNTFHHHSAGGKGDSGEYRSDRGDIEIVDEVLGCELLGVSFVQIRKEIWCVVRAVEPRITTEILCLDVE